MKRITYTGKMNIGGSGIGSTAMHQIKPLYMNKMLGKIYASDLQPPPDASLLHLFFNKIPEIEHPIYFVGDVIFDTIVSLQMEKPSILQTWLNHGYAQMLKYPDAIKIVNLFSAHPDIQAELVGIDTQNPVTKLSLERQRAELEMADWILVPSKLVFDSLKEKGLDKKSIIIPFGINIEKFVPSKKKDNVFRVIFVGSSWERKGGPLLLEAWEKLNLKNAELIICGVSEEIVGEVEENVKVGWVPDLVSTLQNSSIFCLPSLEDGCGLAVLEAMACNLPVIISESTGAKQYVTEGEDGFIIKANDVDAICEKIQYCYDRKANDLQKMGDKARKSIEEWPWERYETMYINFMAGIE